MVLTSCCKLACDPRHAAFWDSSVAASVSRNPMLISVQIFWTKASAPPTWFCCSPVPHRAGVAFAPRAKVRRFPDAAQQARSRVLPKVLALGEAVLEPGRRLGSCRCTIARRVGFQHTFILLGPRGHSPGRSGPLAPLLSFRVAFLLFSLFSFFTFLLFSFSKSCFHHIFICTWLWLLPTDTELRHV